MGKSSINGYKWAIFHGYVKLPEGNSQMVGSSTMLCTHVDGPGLRDSGIFFGTQKNPGWFKKRFPYWTIRIPNDSWIV